jgi:hypothetical protein
VVVAAGLLVWAVTGLVSAGEDVDRAEQDLATARERVEDLREDDAIETQTARDEADAAAPADRYLRLRVTLLRTEQGWKLDGMGQVPYES